VSSSPHVPDPLRAVLLDAGDTILGPYPSFAGRFLAVAEDNGERFEQAAVEAALTEAVRDASWPEAWDDPASSRAFWEGLYGGVLERLGHAPAERARLTAAMFDAFSDPSAYRLLPGAREVLGILAGCGLTLGIVSNFEPWLLDVLDLQGVRDMFATTAVSGVLGIAKPDPGIFAAALTEAGVAAHETVHVGDSPAADVEGALAAGITPVLLDRVGRPSPAGALVITDITQLPGLLGLT
jgi:putative hydrolase of the HAD superfamily